MRFLTWFLIAALLLAWPELRTGLWGTAVYALTTPWTLVAALAVIGLHRLGLRVQQQAARGWAS